LRQILALPQASSRAKEKQVIQPKNEQAHFSAWSPAFRCVPSADKAGLPESDDTQRCGAL